MRRRGRPGRTGCQYEARWTSIKYLDDAVNSDVDIIYNCEVESVIVNNGKATGVNLKGENGCSTMKADVVILSTGGFASPVILQHSGPDKAGQNLFLDMYVNTYGNATGLDQTKEPPMYGEQSLSRV